MVKQPWLLNAALFSLSEDKKRETNASRKARAVAEAIIARVKAKVLEENAKQEETTRKEGKASQHDLNVHGNSTEERLERNSSHSKSNSEYVPEKIENILENSRDCNNFTLENFTDTAPLYNFVEVIIRDQLNPNIPQQDVLTFDELVSEIITMLFTGMDTTKTANVIVLIMLALHPTIQQEVRFLLM
uniref:Uncharacterized protein n=1 Tax=Cacopsylla melanoneura TaxID=428564 RepID=A0A8D8QJX7_9HEMI